MCARETTELFHRSYAEHHGKDRPATTTDRQVADMANLIHQHGADEVTATISWLSQEPPSGTGFHWFKPVSDPRSLAKNWAKIQDQRARPTTIGYLASSYGLPDPMPRNYDQKPLGCEACNDGWIFAEPGNTVTQCAECHLVPKPTDLEGSVESTLTTGDCFVRPDTNRRRRDIDD